MEVPTEVAVAALSVAGAGFAHMARTIQQLIRDRRGEPAPVTLTREQIESLAEVVAEAVSKRLDSHADREERTLERILNVEQGEADRLSRVESQLEVLVRVMEFGATHSAEQHRTLLDRLNQLELAMRRAA